MGMDDFIEMMLTPSIVALNLGDSDSTPIGDIRTFERGAYLRASVQTIYRAN